MTNSLPQVRLLPFLLALLALVALVALGYSQRADAGHERPVEATRVGRKVPKRPKQVHPPDMERQMLMHNRRMINKRAWRQLLQLRAFEPAGSLGQDPTLLPLELKLHRLHEPSRPVPYGPTELKLPSATGPGSPR